MYIHIIRYSSATRNLRINYTILNIQLVIRYKPIIINSLPQNLKLQLGHTQARLMNIGRYWTLSSLRLCNIMLYYYRINSKVPIDFNHQLQKMVPDRDQFTTDLKTDSNFQSMKGLIKLLRTLPLPE